MTADSTDGEYGIKRQRVDVSSDSETIDAETDSLRGKCGSHSDIEKRRRDKMNTFISEIYSLLPVYQGIQSRKLDKLTVLRMTVQHIKSVRGSVNALIQDSTKLNYISSAETMSLLLKAKHANKCLFEWTHPDDLKLLKDTFPPRNHSLDFQDPTSSIECDFAGQEYKKTFFCRFRTLRRESKEGQEGLLKLPHYIPCRCTGFQKTLQSKLEPMNTDLLLGSMDVDLSLLGQKGPESSPYGLNSVIVLFVTPLASSHLNAKQVKGGYKDSTFVTLRLKTQDQQTIPVDCKFRSFVNPWNQQISFIVLEHSVNFERFSGLERDSQRARIEKKSGLVEPPVAATASPVCY